MICVRLVGFAFCIMMSIAALGQSKKATAISGKSVYVKYCLSCHQADGLGVQRLNPPLVKTSWVIGDKSRLIKVVLNGLGGEDIDDESYSNVMPPFNYLNNEEIAAVLTYIRSGFGNKASAVSIEDVKKVRGTPK